jgi:hypothetical protein
MMEWARLHKFFIPGLAPSLSMSSPKHCGPSARHASLALGGILVDSSVRLLFHFTHFALHLHVSTNK